MDAAPLPTQDPLLSSVVVPTDSSPALIPSPVAVFAQPDSSAPNASLPTPDGTSGQVTTASTDPSDGLVSAAATMGTWTNVTAAPVALGTMMLLPNGNVMAQAAGVTNTWYQLTPSPTGGYTTGTWASQASMSTQRLYFASNVLSSDNVFLVGGEYSGSSGAENLNNTGEIYNSVANTWSPTATFPQSSFGDDPSETLPNGNVLTGYIFGPQTYIYNPTANTWTAAGTKLRSDRSDEEAWTKLPDGSILSYDVFASPPTGAGYAQRYIPSTNTWVDAGSVPVPLSGASVGFELGPSILLPDGRVFQIGANSNTALYNPATNTWTAGPVIPNGKGADDAPAAILPNGHVIFTADTPVFHGPAELFDFDPVANTITQMTNLPSQLTTDLSGASFTNRMLALPTGQVMLVTGSSSRVWIFTPSGGPAPPSQPTILSITPNGDGTYTLTGTELNGLSEGANYGDDAEMASNYPIVQLTNTTTGNVSYARTFNWSSVAVATGNTPVTTEFALPAGIAAGNYSLVVGANGIDSEPISATLGATNTFNVGFVVSSSTPASGSIVFATPSSYVVTFSTPIDPSSLSAGDLDVNSIPASGVSLSTDDTTATFTFTTSPVVNFGLQTMSIGAGAVFALGNPTLVNQAFNATFRTDDIQLQVSTTSPPPTTGVFNLPTFIYDVTFNKQINPATVATSSLNLSGIPGALVTSASVLPGNMTAQFTISAPTVGVLNLSIPAGTITDLYGNPGAFFSANYFVNLASPSAFPVPLTQTAPAGSLIYSGTLTGQIEPAGHSDTLTLNVNPGQTITAAVTPTTPTLFAGVGNGGINSGSLLTVAQSNTAPAGQGGNNAGAGTTISDPVTTGSLAGLAFDPVSGVFFGSASLTNGTSDLVTIDPNTGLLLSTIGAITAGPGGPAISIGNLALQPGTDTLYAIRSSADGTGNAGLLYTVNKTTGVATLIGNTGAGAGGGLAFAPNGTLYQTAYNNNQDFTSLNTLNPANAARIATLAVPSFFNGLAVRPTDGVLFASLGTTDQVYTLKPSTGAATLLGETYVGSPVALAFGPVLAPSLRLFDPSNTLLASGSGTFGQNTNLQTIPTTTGGTYTLTVGGAGTTGSYTVELLLNAAVDTQVGGSNNTAQDLSGSSLSLSGTSSREAVAGTISGTSNVRDLYSVNLAGGTSATVALTSLTGGTVALALLNGVPSTTSIWDGDSTTDSNWTTAANWVGNVVPVPGNDLVFPAGAARLSPADNYPAGTDFRSITIAGSGYDLTGNSLTLDAGITTTNATGTNTIADALVLSTGQTFLSTYATTTLTILGALTTPANGQALTVDGTGTTTLGTPVGGAGALVKNGPGTLILENTGNSYTGLTTINAGILETTTTVALGATTAGTVVNSGGELLIESGGSVAEPLTLNGGGVNDNPTVAAGALVSASSTTTLSGTIILGSDAAIGVPSGDTLTLIGAVTLGVHTLTVNSAGTATFSAAVGTSGDTGTLVVNGNLTTGTVNLTAANLYTGSTTVQAGTLTYSGSGGTSASTSYTVDQNATLFLNNSTNNNNRIPATAAITLNGGTLSDTGPSGAASTETVGVITLGRGYSTISTTLGTGGSVVLTASSLARNLTATVNFSPAGLGTSTSNEVLFTTPPTLTTGPHNTGMLPYATVNATDFATVGSNGITAFSGYLTSLTAAGIGAGDVVKLTATTTVSANTVALAGLVLNGTAALTLGLNGFTVHTGALLAAGTQNATISGTGTLDLSGEGIVQTDNPSLTISSALATTDSLVAAGSGTLSLTTTESYAGSTTLNSGTLMVVSGALGSGTFSLVGGTLTASTSGTAVLSNPLTLTNANTIINGPNQITFSGTATLTGVNALTFTLTSNIAFFTGQFTGTGSLEKLGTQSIELSPAAASNFTGGVVVEAGIVEFGTANSPLGSGPLTLAGGDLENFVTAGITLANPVNFNGGSFTTIGTLNLTFTGPVSLTGISMLTTSNTGLTTFGALSGTGALTKLGSNTLVLSGNDTQTGAITSDGSGGTLSITGTNAFGPVGVVLGTLTGNGTLGPISASDSVGLASGTDNPGNSIPPFNQQVASANFSNGGDLTIQIPGLGTAGANYDQLNVTGALTLGGTSTLTLDLSGLTTTGLASNIVTFNSLAGAVPLFDQVAVINNPNNYGVQVTYNANSIDVTIVPGTPAPPVTYSTDVWTGLGGTPNWSNGANWASGTAPMANDNLVFPAGAAQLTAIDDFAAGTVFNSITLSGSGYTLSGVLNTSTGVVNSLTLQAGITTTNATGSSTISIPLVLSGNETFLSTYALTTLTVSGAVTTPAAGQALTVDGTGTTFLTGVISGAGSLVKNGPGTLLIENSNSYSGLTTVNAGFLEITTALALGASTPAATAGTVVNSGATLEDDSTTAVAEPITLNGGGINNNPTIAAGALTNLTTVTWSGPITLGSSASIGAISGTTLTISGGVTLGVNTLTVNSVGSTTFSNAGVGVSGDTGGLVVNGNLTTGTVNLTAANLYTGPTTIQAGTLTYSGSAGTSASTSYTVDQNATLLLNNTTNNNIRLPDTAGITLNGGTLSDTGPSGAASTETVGVITLGRGNSVITTTPVGTGGSVVLTASSLARNFYVATVNFEVRPASPAPAPRTEVLFFTTPTHVDNRSP